MMSSTPRKMRSMERTLQNHLPIWLKVKRYMRSKPFSIIEKEDEDTNTLSNGGDIVLPPNTGNSGIWTSKHSQSRLKAILDQSAPHLTQFFIGPHVVKPVISDSECGTKFSSVDKVYIMPPVFGGSKGYCSVASGILIRRMRNLVTCINRI